MKRKIISLVLCFLMLFTMVMSTACGEEETDPNTLEIDGATSSRAMTLNIWGIKGEGTTDEAIAAVEEAMSNITEAQFNTAIKLNLFSEKDYDKALENKMNEIEAQLAKEAEELAAKKEAEKEAQKNKETTKKEDTTAEGETTEEADETILDEYGLPETKYPEIEDTQLDIFLMTDYDMLMKYSEMGVLSALDESLNASSKLIKSYVHPTFLTAGKVNGKTVAILNNHQIGEYTYILLNKELMAKYYYDADNISSFNDAYNFILDVGREEPSYTPFMGDSTPINLNYFTFDGSRTLVGNILPADAVSGDNGAPKSLFGVNAWVDYIKYSRKLNELGYIGAETIKEGDKFGVGIIKGTPQDVKAFEDEYIVKVIQNPQGTVENIYDGMFAVSKYTKNLGRAMEIVTYLNTNKEFVNTFRYGVLDEHYTVDRDGVITILSDDYNMDPAYIGNSFITYAPEGQPADYWEAAKKQNLDAVLSPYFGFIYTEDMVDMDLLQTVIDYSKDFYDQLDEQTDETIEEFFNQWRQDLVLNTEVQSWFVIDPEGNEKALGNVFNAWYTVAHPAPAA